MKKLVWWVIILLFILFTLKSCALSFPFLLSDLWQDERDSKIPIPEEKKKEEIEIPVAKISFPAITAEMKNMQFDCRKNSEMPANFQKEKMICNNVYNADVEDIKKQIARNNPDRVVYYGKYSISDCPAKSVKEMENMVEGCLEMAKFIDLYQVTRMSQIYQVPYFNKRLLVYWEEDDKKIEKTCGKKVGGCFKRRDAYLFMAPGTPSRPNNHEQPKIGFYPQWIDSRSSYFKTYSNENLAFYFSEVYPKGCIVNQIGMHEMIHYFNWMAYGTTPLWFEESLDTLFRDEIMDALCPPGLKQVEVSRFENGKYVNSGNFDINSDDYLSAYDGAWYEDNACHKAIVLTVNRLFNQQKWTYFYKLTKALNSKIQYDYYHETTAPRIAAAVLESSGNDPEVRKAIYDVAKCPK